MVKRYSLKKDGGSALSRSFRVREFACRDGCDEVLIDGELVEVLQRIRDHFGVAVGVNSGYRTKSYNAKVGGVARSQHLLGTAADITLSGVSPLEVARYAEFLMPKKGGIGVYSTFTHVDVRGGRARWDSRSGREQAVAGWPGYAPENWYEQAREWAVANGLSDGTRALEGATRAELWAFGQRLFEAVKKDRGNV